MCCWDGGCQACLRFNRITAEEGLPCFIMHCLLLFKVIQQLQVQVESIFQNKSPTNGIAIAISVAMLRRENVNVCVSSNCKDVLIYYKDVLISNKDRNSSWMHWPASGKDSLRSLILPTLHSLLKEGWWGNLGKSSTTSYLKRKEMDPQSS